MAENRAVVRQILDDYLATPLDEEEAEEYKRAHWGLSPEALAAEARMKATAGGWDDEDDDSFLMGAAPRVTGSF